MEIKLGSVTPKSISQTSKRMSMILWGSAGSGKTTLAGTAPGKILWLNFDPDGTNALTTFDEDKFIVFDFSSEPDSTVEQFKDENTVLMKQLAKVLADEEIQTVVLDSATSFGDKALAYGVRDAASTSKGRNATLEDPGFSGYGRRKTWMLGAFKTLLQVTARHNKHFIGICHEDSPTTNDKGEVLYITLLLGSDLPDKVSLQLSEVWHTEDTGKVRRIAIRPCRMKKPMKTRMFHTNGPIEFNWNFDAETQEGDTLESWFNKWKENGFKKINVPK